MPQKPPRIMTAAQARRLRRLIERRLKDFEARAEEEAGAMTPAALERQMKALTALMKALEMAAAMEATAAAGKGKTRRDDAIRRSLAKRLEALLAPVSAPRPAGEAE